MGARPFTGMVSSWAKAVATSAGLTDDSPESPDGGASLTASATLVAAWAAAWAAASQPVRALARSRVVNSVSALVAAEQLMVMSFRSAAEVNRLLAQDVLTCHAGEWSLSPDPSCWPACLGRLRLGSFAGALESRKALRLGKIPKFLSGGDAANLECRTPST